MLEVTIQKQEDHVEEHFIYPLRDCVCECTSHLFFMCLPDVYPFEFPFLNLLHEFSLHFRRG
jgi:hypothetical protein